jgi:hypothetical protein
VVTLGGFLAATPALAEIEINPLRLTAGGLVALDAVCLAAERPGSDGPAAGSPGEPAGGGPSGAEEPDGGRAE